MTLKICKESILKTVYGTVTLWLGTESEFKKEFESNADKPEIILASAIYHPKGVVFAVERKRHYHVIAAMDVVGEAGLANTRFQGFLTSHGHYVVREETLIIARSGGQTIHKVGGPADQLFSEDLWSTV